MAKNCVLEFKKINYSWTVKDLHNYPDILDEHECATISSEEFMVGQCKNLTFFLKMTISRKFFTCYLCRSPNTTFTKLMGKIESMTISSRQKTSWCGVINFKSYRPTKIEGSPEYLAEFRLNMTNLFTKMTRGDMLVTCELTVLDNDVIIESVYTPQPCQLIKDDLKELLHSGNNSDVIFEVDGDEIKAHKSMLSARSPVFAAMFQHDMIEKNTNRVKIEDISKEVFELLLLFMYTDEINRQLDLETGIALLKAASKYQLVHLQNLCATQLFKLITKDNATEIRDLAQDHNLPDFVKCIDAFIQSYRT